MSEIIPKGNSLPTERLDPALNGVMKTFRLEEEFKVFCQRNSLIKGLKPDVGFLLFLIEQQWAAIQNLTERVETIEESRRPKYSDEDLLPPKGYLGHE